MKIGFFTDPHIGIEAKANTTVESRARFKQHISVKTQEAVVALRNAGCDQIICLGDLLDTYSNNEATTLQAHMVARACRFVLGGNHDMVNRANTLGTLQLLEKLYDMDENGSPCTIITNPTPNEPYVYDVDWGDFALAFVPHAFTQELFENSVRLAMEKLKHDKEQLKVLCLHCNVGVPGYSESRDRSATLFLTDELRDETFTVFDCILVGHEHVSKIESDGNLIVLGNVFPLTFGECAADRSVWVLDTDERQIAPIRIYDAESQYVSIDVSMLLSIGGASLCQKHAPAFIEVMGRIKPDDYPQFAREMQKLWQANPETFFIKNSVELETVGKAVRDVGTDFIPRTLPEIVEEAIQSTPHAEAYKEAVAALKKD